MKTGKIPPAIIRNLPDIVMGPQLHMMNNPSEKKDRTSLTPPCQKEYMCFPDDLQILSSDTHGSSDSLFELLIALRGRHPVSYSTGVYEDPIIGVQRLSDEEPVSRAILPGSHHSQYHSRVFCKGFGCRSTVDLNRSDTTPIPNIMKTGIQPTSDVSA